MRKTILAGLCFALIATQAQASKLYISEYNTIGNVIGTTAQIANEPVVVDQAPVDFSGGVASSATFNSQTVFVRIICDVQCSVKFGTNPTATNANKVLPALTPEYFGTVQNSGLKISVIANP